MDTSLLVREEKGIIFPSRWIENKEKYFHININCKLTSECYIFYKKNKRLFVSLKMKINLLLRLDNYDINYDGIPISSYCIAIFRKIDLLLCFDLQIIVHVQYLHFYRGFK